MGPWNCCNQQIGASLLAWKFLAGDLAARCCQQKFFEDITEREEDEINQCNILLWGRRQHKAG